MSELKRKPPRHIIGYLRDPNTWDAKAFETAIRAEVENSTGPVSPSDEILIGSLIMQMEALLEAHTQIMESGQTSVYPSGVATSPWTKIRNESTDKIIKILGELALVARGRPKMVNKPTTVDELFEPA